jgi:hypothetical protein
MIYDHPVKRKREGFIPPGEFKDSGMCFIPGSQEGSGKINYITCLQIKNIISVNRSFQMVFHGKFLLKTTVECRLAQH